MRALLTVLTTLVTAAAAGSDGPPPIPDEAPVLLVGAGDLRGETLAGHEAVFAMGRTAKEGPLGPGEAITPGALQESVLERIRTEAGDVLRRTNRVRRAGDEQVLVEASIDMDPKTLRPLSSTTSRGGQVSSVEYDWEAFTIRRSPAADGGQADEIPLDLAMLEVGAHDVWMAALPLRDGFTARIPAVFAATGTKYWAVPRVVGTEPFDIGDGRLRDAWVVELDWWGMGAANTVDNHSPGGGVNGTAGTGGKYWVLKEAIPGTPRVVRVRTEINPEADSVIQLQGGL